MKRLLLAAALVATLASVARANEPHHQEHPRFEVAFTVGATAWVTGQAPEATIGLVAGGHLGSTCLMLRGGVELFKPIGPEAGGAAAIVSFTCKVHRLIEVGVAGTVLLPFTTEAYHPAPATEGEHGRLPEGVVLAAGPQMRFTPRGHPGLVLTGFAGREFGVGWRGGPSLEAEFDLTGWVQKLVRP